MAFISIKPYVADLQETKEHRPFRLFDFVSGRNLQVFSFCFAEDTVLYMAGKTVVEISILHREKPYLESKAAAYLGDARSGGWQYLQRYAENTVLSCASIAVITIHIGRQHVK